MNPATPPAESKKYRHYFIGASIVLLSMGVTWSVDPSLRYMFLGVAVFLLFMGFWRMPKLSRPFSASSHRHTSRSDQRTGQRQGFEDLFRGSSSSPKAKQRLNAILAIGFFGFVVFIFVFIISLVEGGSYEEGPEYIFSQAEQFRSSGEYDSADRYYRRALTLDPENAEMLNSFGESLLEQQRNDSALVMFEKALSLDPDYPEARYNKALTYHYRKEYARSMVVSSKLVKEFPDYTVAIILNGSNYYVQQKYDSAIFYYESGYAKGERSAWLCHVMAYIYDTKRDTQKAVALYREALSYDSTIVEIYDRIGEIYPGQDGNFYRSKARQLRSDQ